MSDYVPHQLEIEEGLNMKMVPANIWRFGFSPCKNIFLVLVPANI